MRHVALAIHFCSGVLGLQQTLPAPVPVDLDLRAHFSATPTAGHAAHTVRFLDESQGSILAWAWDFGDGASSTERSPAHTYREPGDYSVRLTVRRHELSSTTTRSDYIHVTSLPLGYVDERIVDVMPQTTGFLVLGEYDFLTWRKNGEVWRWVGGAFCPEPLVDLSEEVGSWGDHGLLGFARDPAYDTNGHVYLLYVVDRHHLDHHGTPSYDPEASDLNRETIGRLTRYTVFDPSDVATTVDPSSRWVMLGETAATGIPVCATSHGVGTVLFGHDGSLLVSAGDASLGPNLQQECLSGGFYPPKANVQAFRSQLLDSPNGKILRLDPATGDGHPTNPFYDAQDPGAWSSRVWALGLRNPYRFTLRPEPVEHHGFPGVLYVGDVGDEQWEELSTVSAAGQNFGWPVYEGYSPSWWATNPSENLDAPNPLFGGACTLDHFRFIDLLLEDSLGPLYWPNPCNPSLEIPSTIPRWVHRRPAIVWSHGDQHESPVAFVKDYDALGNAIHWGIDDPRAPVRGVPYPGNCSVGGVWFPGVTFPRPFSNVYFHGDFGEGWIKAFEFDDDDELVAIHDFASELGALCHLETDPGSKALYYLHYWQPGAIHRISYAANAAPTAVASAVPRYGPSPLRVQLSAADSVDPEGAPLSFAWDLGEGEPWTPLHARPEPVHVYPSEDATASGQLVYAVGSDELPPEPVPDLPAVHDGVYAEVGTDGGAWQAVLEGRDPWIGYQLAAEREIVALVFQEGLDEGAEGGVMTVPTVEWWDEARRTWTSLQNVVLTPSYPETRGPGYETFCFTFDPVRATVVRLRDALKISRSRRLTVGELRLVVSPDPPPAGPASTLASVTVTDAFGVESSASVLISAGNTPPSVTITSPAPGTTYAVGTTTVIPLSATIADLEHAAGTLTCEWRSELVHDNHTHPEPPDPSCTTSLTLLPHGELEGNVVYWHIELTVTDPEGLATTVATDLIPENDCNLNGIHDATDIASGTALDVNSNGIPDTCE